MILLILSALSAVLILPFVYLRYISGDITVAIIDAFIILILICFFIFVYKTRKIVMAKLVLATMLATVIAILVVIRGQSHLYWLYPAIIAFYYILPERTAGIICLVAITIVSIRIFPGDSLMNFTTMVMSLLFTSIFSYMIFSNYRITNEKLILLATIDPLTLCGNRRALKDKLTDLISDQQRQASVVSLLLLDLDFFKKINDQFGHTVGDLVLEKIAVLVDETMRARDVFSRLSGEEFVAVLPNTDLAQAKAIAVRVMEKISHYNFSKFGIDRNITLSIGVANINDTSAEFDDILHAADLAMYQAKAQGRNQMVSYESIAKDQERRQL